MSWKGRSPCFGLICCYPSYQPSWIIKKNHQNLLDLYLEKAACAPFTMTVCFLKFAGKTFSDTPSWRISVLDTVGLIKVSAISQSDAADNEPQTPLLLWEEVTRSQSAITSCFTSPRSAALSPWRQLPDSQLPSGPPLASQPIPAHWLTGRQITRYLFMPGAC